MTAHGAGRAARYRGLDVWRNFDSLGSALNMAALLALMLAFMAVVPLASGKPENVCRSLMDALKDPGADVDQAMKAELKRHVFRSHIPKAGSSAGTYWKVKGIDSWLECFSECCFPDSGRPCDVALFTNRKCFHLKCARTPADACKPVPSPLPKHNSTFMVVLRDIRSDHEDDGDVGTASSFSSKALDFSDDWDVAGGADDTGKDAADLSGRKPDGERKEADLEHTIFELEEGVGGGERADGKARTEGLPAKSDWLNRKRVGEPCEFGLGECVRNASCVIREGSRSREGHCRCEDGFRKSPDGTRFCVALEEEKKALVASDDDDDDDSSKANDEDNESVEVSTKAPDFLEMNANGK